MAFVLFGTEQGGCLVYRLSLVETRRRPQGGGDGDVEAPAAARGVGQVHDSELGAVQARDGGTHGHGLAGPGVADDHSERRTG